MPLGRATALLLPLAQLLQPVRDVWHRASVIPCLLFRCYFFIDFRCPGSTPLATRTVLATQWRGTHTAPASPLLLGSLPRLLIRL